MDNDRSDRKFRKQRVSGPGRALKHVELDYKRPETLQPFIDDFGRILPRRKTHLNSVAQRRLAREVKRARHIALLPFVDN